jgi:hypothetical protein
VRYFIQQTFHGTDARGANFGIGEAEAPQAEPRTHGRLPEAEIARVAQAYAESARYGDAAAELAVERVVILAGPAGTGRRAAAITMLSRTIADGRPLVGLAPGTTAAQLADRRFDGGTGYLIADMLDGDRSQKESTEYHWERACRAVREAGAYLVVTTATGALITQSAMSRSFRWHRPDTGAVLRAHAGPAVADATIEDVALALGSGAALGQVAQAGRRIATATPEQVADLIAEFAHNDHQHVRDWLDKVDAAIPEVLEVALLAFTAGLPERVIDEELRGFKERVHEFAPEISQSKEAKEEITLRFRQVRKARADHPLLAVADVPVARVAAIAVRHLNFARPAYRAHLLAELWLRLDPDFWAGVRSWIYEITAAGDVDLMASVAAGLALLAQRAPDEVLDGYLGRWTADDASDNEALMAILVISQLSVTGDLATLALQVTMGWATQGSRRQRWIATCAFSGSLGARFPVDATRRLSHLADQGEPLAEEGQTVLFMTLATQGADGTLVLNELQRRLSSQRSRPDTSRVLDTMAALLSITDWRSGRPAIAVFLLANPARVAPAAVLWAHLFTWRPWRARATSSLLSALAAVERGQRAGDGDRDPAALARALGAALGRALPSEDRTGLRPDLATAHARATRRTDRERSADTRESASDLDDSPGGRRPAQATQVSWELLEIFLAACEAPDHAELR